MTDNDDDESADIYDMVEGGKYKNRLVYPIRPMRVAVEGEPYKAEMAKYREEVEVYRAEDARLDSLFWADLLAENRMDADCPFVGIMRRLAWDEGHSNGFSEVAMCFEKLMPLHDLYEAKK